MGVLTNGRAARHMSGRYPEIGVNVSRARNCVVTTAAREGAPYPTKEDAIACLGEMRGLAVILYQAIVDGTAGFDKHGTYYRVDVEDVHAIVPGLVYWTMEEYAEQYRAKETMFMSCEHLFADAAEYFEEVIGRQPVAEFMDPAEALHDYARYEMGGETAP